MSKLHFIGDITPKEQEYLKNIYLFVAARLHFVNVAYIEVGFGNVFEGNAEVSSPGFSGDLPVFQIVIRPEIKKDLQKLQATFSHELRHVYDLAEYAVNDYNFSDMELPFQTWLEYNAYKENCRVSFMYGRFKVSSYMQQYREEVKELSGYKLMHRVALHLATYDELHRLGNDGRKAIMRGFLKANEKALYNVLKQCYDIDDYLKHKDAIVERLGAILHQ